MKAKITIATFFLCIICNGLLAQPRVYNVENTGAGFPLPPLPTLNQLPMVEPLPDPFMWSDGSGRSTNFVDWERRRNEIKAEIENYEIGTKKKRPETISATFTPGATAGTGTLTVDVTVNGQTLTLTSQVALPARSEPMPAVIGMNSPSGSVPAAVFTGRNIARITFLHNQVTTYGNPQNTDPYYRLYPDQNITNAGQYSAWAWGVSRIIDGLELVQSSLAVDLKHVAVTGCSYAGKMALFAGALDERVALTIAQESGGGGAPAWRVSETIGDVEKLGATSHEWFKESMFDFSGLNVSQLPHDHHELMAMVAPRALLVTGNTDFTWLANPSAYVSARAAKEIYSTLGISDRMGFYIDGGHNHCAVPTTQRPAIEAFVDKFLLDKNAVNTDTVTVNPYPLMDYKRWYQWWGTGNPTLPAEPIGKRIWLEAECGTVGASWDVLKDTLASKGTYVVIKSGMNSTAVAPAGAASAVVFSFTIDSSAAYNFNARLNCPTADDDSYWVKIDNGGFVTINGLGTSGWQWLRLTNANLSVGAHTFTIAYREDGAKLDKLLVTTSNATITGLGSPGTNCPAPFVYKAENSAVNCTPPALPLLAQLPVIEPLPDPFMWANGLGRSTSFADWQCRRNEIKAQIENYEIGTKPARPDTITASYVPGTNGGVLTVNVTKNGQTLVLTSQVALPAGSGPMPAVIGMNSPSGSVPASVFTGRNIARITFLHNQVTTYGNPRITDPYFRLYPEQNLSNSGQYSAWAWGVSRIIDGLELVQASLPIDLNHIGVTGCSYAGKMALFAGAFDERIALTIAQESGGGGAPAWRVSETLGTVEKLGATDYNWFKDDMRQFSGVNVSRLPHDHHELMAMVAPRALLVTGNTDFEWLANPSAYVAARAAHEVWKTFGIGDRFGFYIDGSHNHCAVPAAQLPAMQAFVDKFLVGDSSVNTDITVNPYPQIDYRRWFQWWGTGKPTLPNCPPNVTFTATSCAAPTTVNWAEPRDTFPASITLTASSVMTYKGTLNGHGYYEATGQYSWENARDAASSVGAHLVTITSAEENNFVLNNINQRNNSAWIGLRSTGTRGSFVWVTDEPVNYTNWIPGKPDNLYGKDDTNPWIFEPYVHINGWEDPALCRWNDASSNTTARFIAEFDNTAHSYMQISGPVNGSALTPGVYTVCYEKTTYGSNTKDTCCFTVTVACNTANSNEVESLASVTDISKHLQITAYPNPSTDVFRLKIAASKNTEKITMQLTDITGRVIENRTGLYGNQSLNFGANLKAGIYFVRVTQGSSKAIVKVVKQ